MLITVQNGSLSLTADTLGAQIMSIRSADGCEYIWQGDPKYWLKHAPNLFPFIGRLTNNTYRFQGEPYSMGSHGFASKSEFSLTEQSEDKLVFTLDSNPATQAQYPFNFSFQVAYQLNGNCVEITYKVHNRGSVTMPFGIGGHPGFRVPLTEGERFEDYFLEFSQESQPDRVGLSPTVYLTGHNEPYPLEEGKYIPLRHDLFDDDAIVLQNMAREVTLRSKLSSRAVTVSYPQMPYIGFWHSTKTDAPFVCIEPWSSLPARQDVVEEFSFKCDLVHLLPESTYENRWSITIF